MSIQTRSAFPIGVCKNKHTRYVHTRIDFVCNEYKLNNNKWVIGATPVMIKCANCAWWVATETEVACSSTYYHDIVQIIEEERGMSLP